jgi:hypothetical protein
MVREVDSVIMTQEEETGGAGQNISVKEGATASTTVGAEEGRKIVTPPSKSLALSKISGLLQGRSRKVDFLDPKEIFNNADFLPLELVKKRAPEFFLIELKGGIELIYCDNGPVEAFLKPLTDLLFHNEVGGRELQKKMAMLKRGKLIAHVFRRESKNSNMAMLKGDGSNYKRTCLLRYVGSNGRSKADQKEVLLMLREVSKKDLLN